MTLTIGIDPRIRARRIAVRRAEGRRRLRFLLAALAVVGIAVGAWALSRSPLLDLDHVRIEGVGAGRVAAVDAAAGLGRGTPLVDVDLGAVETAVEALPWVRVAEASRDWPGTVRIDVVERVPVATVRTAAGMLLVDAEGVAIASGRDAGLPVIAGSVEAVPGDALEALGPALAVVTELPDDLRVWVAAVTHDGGRATVGLDLVGGAVVELGSVELLADKVEAVRAVLDGTDLSCIRMIDVATPDLTTIRRDPACDGAG